MATDHTLSEKIIAAVDLGSSKTSLAIARVEGNNTQVLFYKSVPSRGITYSEVMNPGQTKEVLRGLIHDAEEELHIKVRQVVVGMPRCNIHRQDAEGTLNRDRSEDCITQEEVDAIKDMAQASLRESVSSKERIYGVIAQSFSTDDYFQLIENDVVGMTGDELTGHFKVFLGKSTPIVNLTRVFNDLGISIARTYFTPLATARAVLTEEETSNGVALLDMGAGATSVSIFDKKVLVEYAAIPFGGDTISGDIHTECGISNSLADNIKKAYGGCMPERLLTLSDKIIQVETDDMSAYTQIPVRFMSQIITARVKEIIDAMLYTIQESNLATGLRKGIVITGGGAELLNLSNYIKELSGYNVRVAYPRHGFVATGYENILKADAATIAGMLLLARDENINCCLYNDDDTTVQEEAKVNADSKTKEADEPVMEKPTADETEDNAPEAEDNADVPAESDAPAETPAPEEEQTKDKEPEEKEKKEQSEPKKGFMSRLKEKFTMKIERINDEINGKQI